MNTDLDTLRKVYKLSDKKILVFVSHMGRTAERFKMLYHHMTIIIADIKNL